MIIGVTGSFGTGKTTVAKMLAAKGARVIDADKLSRGALRPGASAYRKVISCFGADIAAGDGSINRKKLAGAVFGKKGRLKRLTGIIHPFVIKEIRKSANKAGPGQVVVIDAPLLIEAGLAGMVDKLIVVTTDKKTQLRRCKKRKFTKKEAEERIKNQLPLSEKAKMADYIIDNNGTLKETEKKTDRIWEEIKWTLRN